MAFISRITGAVALGAALLVGAGLSAPSAQAGYIVTLTEQHGDVVASGSGAIDLTGLTFRGSLSPSTRIFPSAPDIIIGKGSPADQWTGAFTGPSNFGSGDLAFASDGTGDTVGILPRLIPPSLFVPGGYVSQTLLPESTATYPDENFNTLGVTPGTYEWTWGVG